MDIQIKPEILALLAAKMDNEIWKGPYFNKTQGCWFIRMRQTNKTDRLTREEINQIHEGITLENKSLGTLFEEQNNSLNWRVTRQSYVLAICLALYGAVENEESKTILSKVIQSIKEMKKC